MSLENKVPKNMTETLKVLNGYSCPLQKKNEDNPQNLKTMKYFCTKNKMEDCDYSMQTENNTYCWKEMHLIAKLKVENYKNK